MEIVSANGYDGIDLDWEYPDTQEEVIGFERLARRFRSQLDALGTRQGKPMALKMAASSEPGDAQVARHQIPGRDDGLDQRHDLRHGRRLDRLRRPQRPVARLVEATRRPVSAEVTVSYLLQDRHLPADRIAVGLPLYGRGFPVPTPYASTKGLAKKRLPNGDYANLDTLLHNGWTRSWDAETQVPWLLSPDHSSVIGYDDSESIALKTEWATSLGLRGVFFWQIAGDRLPDGSNPLQEAARKAWDRKTGTGL